MTPTPKPKYLRNTIRLTPNVYVEVRIKATPLPHRKKWVFRITSLKSPNTLPSFITARVGDEYVSRKGLKRHIEQLMREALPSLQQ